MRNTVMISLIVLMLLACGNKKDKVVVISNTDKPEILNKGEIIRFSKKQKIFEYFAISKNSLDGDIDAPAQVSASVMRPENANSETIILFEDPELTDLYTSLLQSIAHYNRDKESFERVADMNLNGAATGKELIEAKTGMIDAATELSEKEARLKMFGFDPNELRKAQPGIVWLISNLNESALSAIRTGKNCKVEFISYPGEIFNGRVSAIGEVLDNSTQTIKVRVTIPNPKGKFKPGMFATISFGLSETGILAVPQAALITAQGKNYVFKKYENEYRRVGVITGKQIGEQTEIKEGISVGDTVVTKGAMLLKGLSIGY